MYSIQEISKKSGLSSRALRHYEEKGLITPQRNPENGYRLFKESDIKVLEDIKKYKRLEFSLEEIKVLLTCDEKLLASLLEKALKTKATDLSREISRLSQSKRDIENLLLTSNEYFQGKSIDESHRRKLMETIKEEILGELRLRREISSRDLDHLERENYLFNTPEKKEFFRAVKECLTFARKENIKLGPARGSSPALLSLYALGWSDFDPVGFNLMPERFAASEFDLHIDVEFERGQKFINFCKGVSAGLKVGSLEAFKLPILDIIENVHSAIGEKLNYDSWDNNDPIILDQFRRGEIEKIFSFDIPANTLLAKHFDENYYKKGLATNMLSEYCKSQPIYDFADLLKIEAIFRPDNLDKKPFMRDYIDRYPRAKKERHYYACLTPEINEYLKPNFGVIVYQEEIMHIIREYTGWDYSKCNQFRRALRFEICTPEDKQEFLNFASEEVFDLLKRESAVVFCKAHSIGAWPKLIKATAILKAMHKDIYYQEIEKWESRNGFSWGDFGFISNGVSFLQ